MSAWKVPTYHAEMSDDSSYSRQADHRVFIRAEKAETAKKQPRNKKRSSKERESLYNSILGDVVGAFLPVVDNLENALKAETKDSEYKKGIELVLKQFKDILKS